MKKYIIILIVLLLINFDLMAQCSMCKAVVEANIESGSTHGLGLNQGILYLMAMPYIAVTVLEYFIFYKKETKQLFNYNIKLVQLILIYNRRRVNHNVPT